jgi:uncharacterized membrane-anchored protein
MGFYSVLLVGTTPIGSLLTGFLATAIGIRYTVATWGILCILSVVIAVVYGVRSGTLRLPTVSRQDPVPSPVIAD